MNELQSWCIMDRAPIKQTMQESRERDCVNRIIYFYSFHQHCQIPLHYLHSLWFFKSSKLLDVEHQVSTVYKLHYKIKSILQLITMCSAHHVLEAPPVCVRCRQGSNSRLEQESNWFVQPCKTICTELLYRKTIPLDGQIILKTDVFDFRIRSRRFFVSYLYHSLTAQGCDLPLFIKERGYSCARENHSF